MAVDQALLAAGAQSMDVVSKVMSLEKPDWSKFETTRLSADVLGGLSLNGATATESNKALCMSNVKVISAVMTALKLTDESALSYLLTVLYNMLREDSSCYKIYEDAVKAGIDLTPLLALLQRKRLETYNADKAAWVYSAIMSHQPRTFDMKQVAEFIKAVETIDCSDLGRLEAFVNLLKCNEFRVPVFKDHAGVVLSIFDKMEPTAPSPILYKSLFATWMLSFSPDILPDLKGSELNVIKKMKSILLYSRVEKVIRISLTVLKNFLGSKDMCEEIVKENLLACVQQLEYEKWRDAELYDEINSVASSITSEVNNLSSFDRYEEELKSGQLSWGYLHTSKFWAENIMKFDTDGFRAINMLASCLESEDPTTLAVACHDMGEFVSLHPLGKKFVAGLPSVKEKVMKLMAKEDKEFREVRREALLCCQKIMLNKWQDIAAEKK